MPYHWQYLQAFSDFHLKCSLRDHVRLTVLWAALYPSLDYFAFWLSRNRMIFFTSDIKTGAEFLLFILMMCSFCESIWIVYQIHQINVYGESNSSEHILKLLVVVLNINTCVSFRDNITWHYLFYCCSWGRNSDGSSNVLDASKHWVGTGEMSVLKESLLYVGSMVNRASLSLWLFKIT